MESEHELQAELQLPHRSSRGSDRAVQRAGQRRVRVVPDRVVEDVERLEAKLQCLGVHPEVPDDRRIHVEDARAEEGVAAGVPPGAQRLQHVGICIEPP